MLPKHPNELSDDELSAWIAHLVLDRWEEGPRLDYKASQGLDRPSDRKEVAKDVSSFANEVGGTLLYGIPEERNPAGRPIPCQDYGIDPINSFGSRVENILVDAIRPALSEFVIRSIPVSVQPEKYVYVVWTPESWLAVHMVEAYGDHRYYRRGQYRATPMTEREVADRYQRLQANRGWLQAFLGSSELNYVYNLLPETFRSRYVACPILPLTGRLDLADQTFRSWLQDNIYPSSGWTYVPFSDGVRTELQMDTVAASWRPYVAIYKNGAVCAWLPTQISERGDGELLATFNELTNLLDFLKYAATFYGFLKYSGPLRVQVDISHPQPSRMASLKFPSRMPFASRTPRLISHDYVLRFATEVPASRLIANPNQVLKLLADELYRAFGFWDANCFDENLNLRPTS